MECSCNLRNVHDEMAAGKTAYEKRFGVLFDGCFARSKQHVSYKNHFFQRRVSFKSSWFMSDVRERLSGDCSSRTAKTWTTCASESHTKRDTLQAVSQGTLSSPSPDGFLKLFDDVTVAKGLLRETSSTKQTDTVFGALLVTFYIFIVKYID